MMPDIALIAVAAVVVAVSLAALAALRGWQDWLELRREQLASGTGPSRSASELAELRQRVRRLEAIASGIE